MYNQRENNMPSFTFVCVLEEEGGESTITSTFDSVYLPHIVNKMEEFLKGSGFYFKGLKVVEDTEEVDLDLS